MRCREITKFLFVSIFNPRLGKFLSPFLSFLRSSILCYVPPFIQANATFVQCWQKRFHADCAGYKSNKGIKIITERNGTQINIIVVKMSSSIVLLVKSGGLVVENGAVNSEARIRGRV